MLMAPPGRYPSVFVDRQQKRCGSEAAILFPQSAGVGRSGRTTIAEGYCEPPVPLDASREEAAPLEQFFRTNGLTTPDDVPSGFAFPL